MQLEELVKNFETVTGLKVIIEKLSIPNWPNTQLRKYCLFITPNNLTIQKIELFSEDGGFNWSPCSYGSFFYEGPFWDYIRETYKELNP